MTCETCKANKVCDHNKYGFENCGNYISVDAETNSKPITFKQFVETFNFGDYDQYCSEDVYKYNTKNIRVYHSNIHKCDWFEFGVYDFGEDTWNILEKSLSKNVLESYIDCITYNGEINMVEVYIAQK